MCLSLCMLFSPSFWVGAGSRLNFADLPLVQHAASGKLLCLDKIEEEVFHGTY
jgi:hypothetical protein